MKILSIRDGNFFWKLQTEFPSLMGIHQKTADCVTALRNTLAGNGSTFGCGRDPTMSTTYRFDYTRGVTERITQYFEGDVVIVRHSHGINTDGCAEVERLQNGDYRLVFINDCYALIDDANDNIRRPFHIRSARKFRTGVDINTIGGTRLEGDGISRYFPSDNLRSTCQRFNEKLTKATGWGGDDKILLYEDEVFVPDHVRQGTSGWILNQEEFTYLSTWGI